MKCGDIEKLLPDYLSGDIEPGPRRSVEEHLQHCQTCAEKLREYRAYAAAMSSTPAVKAPSDFMEKLNARLERRTRRSIADMLFRPFHLKVGLEAAGLAAMALVVFFFWRPFEHPRMALTPIDETALHEAETPRSPEKKDSPAMKEAPPEHRARRTPPPETVQTARNAEPGAGLAPGPSKMRSDALLDESSEVSLPLQTSMTLTLTLTLSHDAAVRQDAPRPRASSVEETFDNATRESGIAEFESKKSLHEEKRWKIDDALASLVIEHHGTIITRKLDRRRANIHSYTIELPSRSVEPFINSLQRWGAVSGERFQHREGLRLVRITLIFDYIIPNQ
jgi:hypothetical protein